MSDYIPFEIQVEILKRLPVKSLVQFRSVAKRWKSLIDSSEFIAGYSVRQLQHQRLVIWYDDPVDNKEKYISFVDDETFVQQELAPTAPVLAKYFKKSGVVGSSQGLLCLYGYYTDPTSNRVTEMVVLWNPAIKKSVGIHGPSVWPLLLETVVGFGVCPITGDPTIVMIKLVAPLVVKIFTLSTGCWRIPSSNLPGNIEVRWSQVVIERFIYWFAFEMMVTNGRSRTNNLIMSFDLTTHVFRGVHMPDYLAHQSYDNLFISKVWESLAVLEYSNITDKQVYDVWIMDHGAPKLFTKLFTINAPYVSIKPLGFRKSGEPIMETRDDVEGPAALVVYEPRSERINDIGIYGKYGSFFVDSYMETLLLHDRSDCSMYHNCLSII